MNEKELERQIVETLARQAEEADRFFRDTAAARITARRGKPGKWANRINLAVAAGTLSVAVVIGLWAGGLLPRTGTGYPSSPSQLYSQALPGLSDAPSVSAVSSGTATPAASETQSGSGMAEIVNGDLLTYSEPRTDSQVVELVSEGRVIWIDSARESGGQLWLRVQFSSLTWDGQEIFAWTPAEQQLHRMALSCPETPDLAALSAMSAQEHVDCFDQSELTVIGFVVDQGPPTPAYTGTPEWIAQPSGLYLRASEASEADTGLLALQVDPDLGLAVPRDRWVEVKGHFDDPAAQECRRYPAADGLSEESPDEQTKYCQQRFVVQSLQAVDEPIFPTPPA